MVPASKRSKKSTPKTADKADKKETRPAGQTARNVRETIESIVVAFVLAFLFRTFEAEAFVIPTGSMAPTLMGRHKDVYCPQCGFRYQASASSEDEERIAQLRAVLNRTRDLHHRAQIQQEINGVATVATTCPMCRWTLAVADLSGRNIQRAVESGDDAQQPSFSGDRIIVSKLAYTFSRPQRWDVVVFRYPGEAYQNYIKRMIGLPGESIRIYGGDIYFRPADVGSEGGTEGDGFSIARKPPSKLLAMMQAVHDTRYFPETLQEAGWPFRWSVWPPEEAESGTWESDVTVEEVGGAQNAVQHFSTDGSGRETAWIRYQHIVPDYDDWLSIEGAAADELDPRPQLITDFYAYNTDLQLSHALQNRSLRLPNGKRGLHWVGDLILECEITVEEAAGEILLDLVEGGKHFRATIDLKSGRAEASVVGFPGFSASGETPLDEPGTYQLRFANADDRLLLWVNDRIIDLGGPEGGAPYSARDIFGGRKRIVPSSTASDAGDLAPAGIGSRGAAMSVKNLRLLRDIYYIADRYDRGWTGDITDLKQSVYAAMVSGQRDNGYREYLTNPQFWHQLVDRREYTFNLAKDQFFVLGDNSPSSKDSRLWLDGEKTEFRFEVKKPGGPYVERRLLTGQALFVYWPHSWGTIPGTGIPLPFFPNVGDMRLVK